MPPIAIRRMPAIAELHLKANVLAHYGLLDIAYPIAAEDLHGSIYLTTASLTCPQSLCPLLVSERKV